MTEPQGGCRPEDDDDGDAGKSADLKPTTTEPLGRFSKGDAGVGERSSDLMKTMPEQRAGPIK
jgi:hypothetical protein